MGACNVSEEECPEADFGIKKLPFYSIDSLNVSGDITAGNNMYARSFYVTQGTTSSSDERLKKFQEPIKTDLNELASLRKSYFTFNDSPNQLQLGMSAQEVQAIYPEVVNEMPNGYLGIDYSKLSVIALKAIDVLHERIKCLEEKIENLSK